LKFSDGSHLPIGGMQASAGMLHLCCYDDLAAIGCQAAKKSAEIYSDAEYSARAAGRGLWSDPRPQPPWYVRHPDTASAPTSDQRAQGAGLVIGNKGSGIYHVPSCPDYNKVSEKNRLYFKTKEEAEKAGYRMARNCP
jgi:hypothetical protein